MTRPLHGTPNFEPDPAPVDYRSIVAALRALGHDADLEGGGAAATLISIGTAGGRRVWWDADGSAWFGAIIDADGDPWEPETAQIEGDLEIRSVSDTSTPADIAKAISTNMLSLAVRGQEVR